MFQGCYNLCGRRYGKMLGRIGEWGRIVKGDAKEKAYHRGTEGTEGTEEKLRIHRKGEGWQEEER
jgi:hypothetical protein